ncbi:hypothetical protein niasHS_016676 [Heterodera schachtii]|uniref:14-3-3 domain-containing protein n=1 Tax=Heterodera schachtii TaxID=97005 RepID=A0ABD2HU80_HETSC
MPRSRSSSSSSDSSKPNTALLSQWYNAAIFGITPFASPLNVLSVKNQRSELATSVGRESTRSVVELAKGAYQEAMDIAISKIAAINPTRLDLALNFSVFNFEILKSVDEARKVAQKAIDLAQAEIATLTLTLADNASINLRIMRENMELWTPEGGSHAKTTWEESAELTDQSDGRYYAYNNDIQQIV